ncbi:MAG: CDP-diacylglycerol--glycerol-3-phosphate 3-phosphatidyltransferase [Candidatus Omnitrophica bacterium 4484_213]|nr:MAG: CDP-diacylglycerol--glycerol-3-phosphate 3-phosphatidyltransferase [Candidatus Omnitrophica bacterium 4484_213]
MNLPNILTITRIFLTFLFIFFLLSPRLFDKVLALLIFSLASLTDYYDGKIARRRNLITNFGKIADPIADKILVLAPFLCFVQLKLIPAWMVILIVSREFIITGVRIFALSQGQALAADKGGKHKTVSQMSTIFFILLFLIGRSIGERFNLWSVKVEQMSKIFIYILMLIATTLTLSSGISYLWKNKGLLK